MKAMDSLKDPWVFAGASAAFIALVSYVWGVLDNAQTEPGKNAARVAIVALFSLALLTWLANGTGEGAPMTTPYITE